MEFPHKAFIIQAPTPSRPYCTLFTLETGLLDVYARSTYKNVLLQKGYWIEYVSKEYPVLTLERSEIIALPQNWVQQDIYFLHTVLEVIQLGVAYGAEARAVFSWCLLLATKDVPYEEQSFFKTYFLCNLFLKIGVYAEPHSNEDISFFSYIEKSFEECLVLSDRVFLEKKMLQWLRASFALHPYTHRFKLKAW